jgi:hypothetical protein
VTRIKAGHGADRPSRPIVAVSIALPWRMTASSEIMPLCGNNIRSIRSP